MNHTLVLTVRRVKRIWHAGLKRLRFFGRWNMEKFYKNQLDLDVRVKHAMPPEIVDVVKIVHNPFASGFLIPYVLCVHGQRRKDGGCIHPIEELYRLKYSHRL